MPRVSAVLRRTRRILECIVRPPPRRTHTSLQSPALLHAAGDQGADTPGRGAVLRALPHRRD